jgi:AraC family transcriptional regulator
MDYHPKSTYYQEKVKDVLNYINAHLSDNLNVKLLSEQFGISFFHFHRIFKAFLNEPLGSYINRQRLETAVNLIRYSNEPISDIAQKIGYNDCSAFSKAFSKEFGLSPQEFKSNKTVILNTHIDYKINNSGKLVSDIKPKIIQFTDKYVVFTRFIGEYGCDGFNRAWDDFLGFAIQNKILGWKPEIFSIYYDYPSDIDIENYSADFCIVTSQKVISSGQISCKTIPGGKYAAFRYKGPYDRLWELYETILGVWIINVDCKLRDAPIVEKYLNYSFTGNPNNFLTEIYIPIE